MTRGVGPLISAQFVSGLADNALLIVAIAQLMAIGEDAWMAPALKLVFTVGYVLLAPFVGALADRWPKAWVMFWANALKAAAAVAMAFAVHPLAAFALAGLGAACYSPAKYGLLTELVPPNELVRANGWLEVTMVASIILGTATGGFLISDAFFGTQAAIGAIFGLYVLAAGLNLRVPDSGARYHRSQLSPVGRVRDFARANAVLWLDPRARVSLGVTTLFWGAGATLQFVVLAWAQSSLGLALHQSAYLQAVVAIGIVLGAAAAGRWVRLRHAERVLPIGLIMGLGVPLMTLVTSVDVAVPLLVAVGAMAGFLVVPMNALLQHRGHVLLNAGQSIAVQNFNENLSVLAMLALYATMVNLEWPVNALIYALGASVAAGTAAAVWSARAARAKAFTTATHTTS